MRLILAFITLLFTLGLAQAAPELIPAPPPIAAKAYLLLDFHSGKVLAEKNADKRIQPASLTKLMTAFIVSKALATGSIKLDDKVRISKKAWRTMGSRMFVNVNTLVSVRKLIKGMIVQSGNDATVALAQHVAGSQAAFVTLMNQYARQLGMTHTHFADVTGLPRPTHYSTARDLATLTRALIRDFPQDYHWYSDKVFTYNHIRQYNRNRLLWLDKRVDGLKTGHTKEAGYCLIASAKQGDMRLISVVLGANSSQGRVSASRSLLDYGFRFYNTYKLYAAGQTLATRRIWKGQKKQLKLGLDKGLYITIPRGNRNDIKAKLVVDSTILAPVERGHAYGSVQIDLGHKKLATRPLVALSSMPRGNLWRRLTDSVILLFK